MAKWYGNLTNRLEENRQFCEEITVGTGMTEYSWSDRHPYEVIAVRDQKHVTVRALDHKHIGEWYANEWELISNEDNPTMDMVKRGKYWYEETTFTRDILEHDSVDVMVCLALNEISREDLERRGTIKRYRRMNVSFGTAEYYYDYEF